MILKKHTILFSGVLMILLHSCDPNPSVFVPQKLKFVHEKLENKNVVMRNFKEILKTPIKAEIVKEFVKNLNSEYNHVGIRAMAAEALGEAKGRANQGVISVLVSHLRHKNGHLRSCAAGALIKIGPGAVPALMMALGHTDWVMYSEAARVLGGMGPRASASIPALIKALENQYLWENSRWEVSEWTAAALGTMGSRSVAAVPALTIALASTAKSVRERAATSLGMIGLKASGAVPDLIRTAEDINKYVREESVIALGKIGVKPPEVIFALQKRLMDRDVSVRYVAKKALKLLGHQKKQKPILRIKKIVF